VQDTWITGLSEQGVQTLLKLAGIVGVYLTPKNMKRHPPEYDARQGRNHSHSFNISRPGPLPKANSPQNATVKVTVDVSVSLQKPQMELHEGSAYIWNNSLTNW
jgi:hypothetical protein